MTGLSLAALATFEISGPEFDVRAPGEIRGDVHVVRQDVGTLESIVEPETPLEAGGGSGEWTYGEVRQHHLRVPGVNPN